MKFIISYYVWGLLPATALASQKVLGSKQTSPFDGKFEQFAIQTLQEWHVPGIAIAVVDGENTWAAGYGNATLPSTLVTPSTLFYTGSNTKAFVAASLSVLMDSGAYPSLTWRTPIASLIREDFVLGPEYSWAQEHLTLEDALSHRTGFSGHDMALPTSLGADRHHTTVRDFTRALRYLPMKTEPRTDWHYCNRMFAVVSHVIQTLTRKWLGTLLKELIWGPLEMNSTYFSLPDALDAPEHLAGGYYWDYDSPGGGFHQVPFLGLDEVNGAGAIVSNVLDYTRWIRCLLDEAEPLSKEGHAAIKTPRMIEADSESGLDGPETYSLGWFSGTYKGHRVFHHSGGMEAYGAELYFFPELKYGIVTMANTAVTSNFVARILLWKLINDKLGIPEQKRFDWVAVFKQSLKSIRSKFDEAVDSLYPDRPDSPLPHSLPLRNYTGTYYHPAYQKITLELDEASGGLRAAHDDFVWQMTFDFQHVSGEFWVVYMESKNSPSLVLAVTSKAEFKIGADGTVGELLVEFMDSGSEGVIPFLRIE